MRKILDNVYQVADSGCSVYLITNDAGHVLIDVGMDFQQIKAIEKQNLKVADIFYCVLTHCHIDHIFSVNELKVYNPKTKIVAHELDAKAIEEFGHDSKTAASWYHVKYTPVKIEHILKKDIEIITHGGSNLQLIHIPGHTPGSIAVFIEIDGKKVLFGQDIHGPFMESFGSNLYDYHRSMEKLLDLKADILCEGHYGIINGEKNVREFIESHMDNNPI